MMVKICRYFEISNISCDSYKQALGFCIHMLKTHHKVCFPIGTQIYFKEYDSEPCDFVFGAFLDYVY